MTLLTVPRATIPLVAEDGVSISTEWYRCIRDISERVGGVSGASTDDLSRSAFEDAGIEELKAWAYSALDEQRQRPQTVDQDAVQPLLADLESIRAQLFALQKSVESLQQGTML